MLDSLITESLRHLRGAAAHPPQHKGLLVRVHLPLFYCYNT